MPTWTSASAGSGSVGLASVGAASDGAASDGAAGAAGAGGVCPSGICSCRVVAGFADFAAAGFFGAACFVDSGGVAADLFAVGAFVFAAAVFVVEVFVFAADVFAAAVVDFLPAAAVLARDRPAAAEFDVAAVFDAEPEVVFAVFDAVDFFPGDLPGDLRAVLRASGSDSGLGAVRAVVLEGSFVMAVLLRELSGAVATVEGSSAPQPAADQPTAGVVGTTYIRIVQLGTMVH